MKNFTTCICIMGLSGVASADVVMDQIGPDDGTGIGTNITGCQDFEAAFDIYDIATLDNFTGAGEVINMVEMVLNGWNGFVDPSGVTGYTSNLYSAPSAAALDLIGDIDSSYADAADATVSATWLGAGFNVMMPADMAAASGDNWVSMVPSNEFGTFGQTGVADVLVGDGVLGWQANPGGGFAMPDNMQEMTNEAAYRLHSGAAADPCSFPLPETCAADVDGDGSVAVSDVLAIIGSWGNCGDGTYRPAGDIAPMPNGDCCVTVADVLAVVGNWGADCTVYGACCYGDGMCDDLSNADDCATAGGLYFGDDSACADNSCAAAACCLDSTTCSDLTEDACVGVGGSYKGDGTVCATTDCAAVEAGDECTNAWTAVDGANAFDTSNCTPSGDAPTDELCAGTFLDWGVSNDGWLIYVATGGMTTFDTCDATSYDTSMVLYEGSCSNQVACNGDAADSTGCQGFSSEISNYDCVAGETYYIRIGAWNGVGQGAGTLNITPPSTGFGACCFADETCIDVLAGDCDAFGGFFQGDGTECASGLCEAGPGDECATAVDAFEGANLFDTTFMTASTPVPDDSQCPGEALDWLNSPDMWMQWEATSTGTATFTTCDTTSFDTSMVIYAGTCENQIACNGDADDGADGAGGACQAWYSRIDDVPVTAGNTYYIRLGGWQEEVGAGTLTITSGADVAAACCFSDGSCTDLNAADCLAAGGSYDSAGACADVACPQPFACPAGADIEGDPCQVDSTEADSNCGMNCDPAAFGSISLSVPVCGNASVMVALETRDTDWYYNADINAGGDFTLSGASNGSAVGHAFGIVDNVALVFVQVFVTSTEDSVTFTLPPGDYSVFAAQNSFTAGGECGSGTEEYWVMIE